MDVRESFIFHAEYIADIPEELQPQYAMHAINYALKGIEPELEDWRDIKMWNAIKNRIDQERELYEKKCSNLKQKQKKTPDTENNASETEEAPSDTDSDLSDTEKGSSETENAKSDGEYEFESEFVNESEIERESVAPKVPDPPPLPATEYAKKVFDIFTAAGLPNARGKFPSFLQRDFKNGMAYVHSTYGQLHSDDVIGACRNYAKTVNDPRSFITGKYSFDRFVTFRNFVDFLPANYSMENFIDTKKNDGTAPPAKKTWMQECPSCHEKALEWSNELEKYRCVKCGKVYTFEQIAGG